jgi:hypothetical protein
MRNASFREALSVAAAALACLVLSGAEVSAQVVDNPGFKALPRPINYATPLAPAGSSGAGLNKVGGLTLPTPAVAFVGPGGKNKDRVYVVDAAGNVTVLTVK